MPRLIPTLVLILALVAGGLYLAWPRLDLPGRLAGQGVIASHPAASGAPARLQAALQSAGAHVEAVHLEGWALLASAFLPRDELAAAARKSAQNLGLPGQPAFKIQADGPFCAYNYEGEIEPGVVLFLSVQSLRSAGPRGETYLLFNVDAKPGVTADGAAILSRWEERFLRAFGSFRVKPHLTLNLTGAAPGLLEPKDSQALAERLLRELGAKKVEGIAGPDLTSISAYAPGLNREVEVAGRKVNLSLAIRRHASDGYTYIHLGSPLLSGEY